jgi:proteasome lid subunit RPN8/RPN11
VRLGNADQPVYRTRPLPVGPLRGRFLIPEALVTATRESLTRAATSGKHEGGHEGLVFWAGLQSHDLTAFTSCVVPAAEHSRLGVFVGEAAYGRAASAARARGVLLLAQVHSHPGSDTRHSDGDDDLIIMPYDGMLSVVVPRYGVAWTGIDAASIHQFQSDRWVRCTPESVHTGVVVVPATIDARGEK